MARSNMMSQQDTRVLAGVAVIAAAVGAITAMLVTPKSGPEMRTHLKNKARNSKDMAMDKAYRMKDKMSRKTRDFTDSAQDMADTVRDASHEMMDQASESIKQKTDAATEQVKHVSDHIDAEIRRRGTNKS
jgi:gas vesicle protein